MTAGILERPFGSDGSRPGALTGMVNWYRALLRKPMPLAEFGCIAAPTRIIWGKSANSPSPASPSAAPNSVTTAPPLISMRAIECSKTSAQRVSELLLEF